MLTSVTVSRNNKRPRVDTEAVLVRFTLHGVKGFSYMALLRYCDSVDGILRLPNLDPSAGELAEW